MTEGPPNQSESENPGRVGWVREEAVRLKLEAIIALAKELSESQESFPFPGIDSDAYSELKAAEAEAHGYGTPIDELIERSRNEGIKIVLGKHLESGVVFILPAQSNDIDDNIFPKHLQTKEGMNDKLQALIFLSRS